MKNQFLRMALTVYLSFLVLLLVAVGLGFLIAALFIYLSSLLTIWAAALTTGFVVLLAVLFLLIAAWLVTGTNRRSRTGQRHQTKSESPELFNIIQQILKDQNLDARELSIYAMIAGGLLGASPELRKFLLSIISAESSQQTPNQGDT